MSGPTYTYTANTPQAATAFNLTQAPILNNFLAINEYVLVNHVGFNNVNDSGKHAMVAMPNQGSLPVTGTTEIEMFTQVTGSPNPSEIFILYPTGAQTTIPVQISNQTISQVGFGTSGGNATQGWCSFPSGILFRWGNFPLQGSKIGNVTYTSGPIYTNPIYFNSGTNATSSGCLNPVGILINSETSINLFTPIFQAYASTSVVTNFNYLNMGM